MASKTLRRSVTVRVPATSANMGPGFDAVGIALNVCNDLTVSSVDPATGEPWASFAMEVEGEGAAGLPRDGTNLVVRGLDLAFKEAGYPSTPPLHYKLTNRIPVGGGLGSSSAAIVAGLLAGLALTGHAVAVENEEKALQLAATVEGHVDNLAPCIYGGLQIGVHTGKRWYTTAVSVPTGLQCILFIPDKRQDTEGARAILPKEIKRSDAVYNIGRVALLINAFASGQLDDLPLATQDALHQPARAHIMPWLTPCVDAALAAGAKGAFLSGAGSSIMAITTGRKGDIHGQRPTERRDIEVARAMARAAHAAGYSGRVLITQPTLLGAHVTEFDGDGSAVISGRGLGVDLLRDDDGDGVLGNGRGVAFDSASLISAGPSASPGAADGGAAAPWTGSVRYVSTRGSPGERPLTFTEAVFAGLAPDGGLYVPVPGSFPSVPLATLDAWRRERLPYYEVAARVIGLFVGADEIAPEDLRRLCRASYGDGTEAGMGAWAVPGVAPVYARAFVDTAASSPAAASAASSAETVFVAEHFHGPTAAFKDLALQFLGNLFEFLLTRERAKQQQAGAGKAAASSSSSSSPALPTRLTILGATSGDTGSAAIAGLRGKKGVEVFILHPQGRVAAVQEMQMTTCLDRNVHNAAVTGADFDACQAGVKAAFADKAFRERHSLSAVNSINWARILAQTVYYVWTWMQWADLREGTSLAPTPASPLPPVTFVVPTGNFGNALSAHYARLIGVPIRTVCVATNANDILHRFIAAEAGSASSSRGDYTVRGVTPTLAPSMDIQVASNFERYLYHAACSLPTAAPAASSSSPEETHARAAALVREWTSTIQKEGRLPPSFPTSLLATVAGHFTSCAADDATIDAVTRAYLASPRPYAVCPHTACGLHAASAVPSIRAAVSRGEVVVMATAHPAKFASGTPALAEAGLYYREVEGPNARPVVPVNEEVEKRVKGAMAKAAGGGEGTPASVLSPLLSSALLGLSSRPRQCAVLPDAMGSAKMFVDALQQA